VTNFVSFHRLRNEFHLHIIQPFDQQAEGLMFLVTIVAYFVVLPTNDWQSTFGCQFHKPGRWDCPSMPKHAAYKTPEAGGGWGTRSSETAVPSAGADRSDDRCPTAQQAPK